MLQSSSEQLPVISYFSHHRSMRANKFSVQKHPNSAPASTTDFFGVMLVGSPIEVLPILGEPSAAVEPSNGAFDDPSLGQHCKSFDLIGALDDVGFEMGQDFREWPSGNAVLGKGGIGEELLQERIHSEQGGKQQVKSPSRSEYWRNERWHGQQNQRVYENCALPLIFFRRIIAMRIDAGPLPGAFHAFGYR